MSLIGIKENLLFALKHPRAKVSLLVFMLSISLLMAVVMLYWWPLSHTSQKLKVEIENRQREIIKAEDDLKLANATLAASKKILMIEKKLDASVSQAALVQNIAVLARKYNVKIISVSYEEGKVINEYFPLIHMLTVQASYRELRSFILGLENLQTFTLAQEAVLSRGTNPALIKAQLNVITYRRNGGVVN